MDNKRFIEILKTKECNEEERNDFMTTLANGQKTELSDIIVSSYNYDNNLEKVCKYIFKDLGQNINKFYCNIMTIDEHHTIVNNHNSASVLSKIFGAIDEYAYVIVEEDNEVNKYATISEVITDFLIGIELFPNLCEEDFAAIIEEINDHDMFYSELE